MKKKMIIIHEQVAIDRIKKYVDECDGDEIARILGDVFGGVCYQNKDNPEYYDFMPDKYYSGEFDDLKQKEI